MSAALPRRPVSPLPAWAYYAALALVFLAPSQLAYALDRKDGPFIGYAEVLAGLLCLAVFLAVLVRRNWRELTWPPLAAWALVAVSALSLTQALEPKSAVIETVQWGLYLVAVYTLFANVFTDRRRIRAALLTLAVSTTLVVIWAFGQYWQTPLPPPAPADPEATVETLEAYAQVRAGFTNRNTLSAFLALVLPLLVGVALHGGRPGKRIWWLALGLLGLVTMLSGPLLWVTLLALAGVAFTARGAARWITLAVLVGFVAAMPAALPRNYATAVTEQRDPYEQVVLHTLFGQEPRSATVVKKRWLEWVPALRMLSAHPALGVGAGNYQANIGQYYEGDQRGTVTGASLPNVKKTEPDTNNLYLVIAGSTGLCGLAALLAVFGHFWRRSRWLAPAAGDRLGRGLAAALPASMFSLMVGNLFTAMFVRGLSLVIVLLFALTYAGARLWRETPTS